MTVARGPKAAIVHGSVAMRDDGQLGDQVGAAMQFMEPLVQG